MVLAIQAARFADSLGVNTHIAQGWSNTAEMLSAMQYLGINNIRDGINGSLSVYETMVQAGIRIDGIATPSVSGTVADANSIASLGPSALRFVEGPNEVNLNPVSYNGATSSTSGSFLPAAQFQAALYQAVTGDAALPNTKVLDLTSPGAEPDNVGLQYLTVPSGAGSAMPDGTSFADYANVHVYPDNGAQNLAGNSIWNELHAQYGQTWLASHTGYSNSQLATLPKVMTETGYPTVASGTDQRAVDGTVQAGNITNMVLDALQSGYSMMYIYELLDDPNQAGDEANYGIFQANGTPKPAATAIHDLTSILSDTAWNALSFATSSLNYTISNLPSTGNSLLFEKSNGAFDLAVWNEAPDWNSSTQSEITSAPQNVIVNLGATYSTVEVFDPLNGSAPFETLTNVSSVTLGLTNHAMIIEVEPNGGVTPTPTATPSPDNTVIVAGSTAAITDAAGNTWTLTAGGQVAVNGATDTTTSGVVELAFEKGLIWQENVNSLWWSKTSPNAAWGPAAGTATSPVPAKPNPSPDNTVIVAGSTAAITDAAGNTWTITAGGQVAVNGATDTTTSGVVELAFEKGLIWQENVNSLWWSKTSPNAAWGPAAGTATSPVPVVTKPTASPDNTVILAGSSAAITDAAGNMWTITAGGQVAVNGTTDTTTSGVVELAYEKSLIWQENVNSLWWSKASPSAAWGPAAGTATSPVPVVTKPTASPDNTVILAGSSAAITDAAGNTWAITGGGQVAVNGATDTTTSGVVELAFEKGLIWQENVNSLWWSKTSPNAAWGPAAGTATSPVPVVTKPTASPDNTVILAGSTNAITDAAGNMWTITAGGQVAVNGATDTTTSGVVELDYTKGLIWQENVNSLWWSKTSPSAAWGPANGTAVPPVSISVTNTATASLTTIDATKVHTVTDYGATFSLTAPGVAKVTLGATSTRLAFFAMSSLSLTAGSAAASVAADRGTNSFIAGTGTLDVTGGAGADAYTYHSGDARLTVEDFSATKGDTLTVDKALQGLLISASDGHGGTLLTFGSHGAGIDLKAVPAMQAASIHWV